MKKFDYELKHSVEIAGVDGKLIEAVSVEVFAPTNKVMSDVNIIDAEFKKARIYAEDKAGDKIRTLTPEQLKAIKEMNDNAKKEIEDIEPIKIVDDLIAYGADMNKCMLALCNILTSGNKEKPMCRIDVVKMTKPIFEDLSIYDTKNILGLYIKHFLDTSRSI